MTSFVSTSILFNSGGGICLTPGDWGKLTEGQEIVIKLVSGQPVITFRMPVVGGPAIKPKLGKPAGKTSIEAITSNQGFTLITPSGNSGVKSIIGPTTKVKTSGTQKVSVGSASRFSDSQVQASVERFEPRLANLARAGLDHNIKFDSYDPAITLSELMAIMNVELSAATAQHLVSKENKWRAYFRRFNNSWSDLVNHENQHRLPQEIGGGPLVRRGETWSEDDKSTKEEVPKTTISSEGEEG